MMKIGTVRSEEARIYNSHVGYHSFHAEETQEPYGSFEVYWFDPLPEKACVEEVWEEFTPGWCWRACFPGCLPDGDPCGPFATSRQALKDADEWNPEFDLDYEED